MNSTILTAKHLVELLCPAIDDHGNFIPPDESIRLAAIYDEDDTGPFSIEKVELVTSKTGPDDKPIVTAVLHLGNSL